MHGWFYSLQNYCSWSLQLLLEFLFQDISYREYELAAISPSGVVKKHTTALAIDRHFYEVENSLLSKTRRMSVSWAGCKAYATSNEIVDCLALLVCASRWMTGSSPSVINSLLIYVVRLYTYGHTEQQQYLHASGGCVKRAKLWEESAVPRVVTLAFAKSLVQPLSSI